MKNKALIFIPITIIVLFSILASGLDTKAPEIFFKENTYVAGEVMEGDIIEHAYTVYNRGSEVLRIDKVRPG